MIIKDKLRMNLDLSKMTCKVYLNFQK